MVGVICLQLRLGEQFIEIFVFFNRMMIVYWMKFDLVMIERDDFPTFEVRWTFFRNYGRFALSYIGNRASKVRVPKLELEGSLEGCTNRATLLTILIFVDKFEEIIRSSTNLLF